mmetsp:Transcript_9496/g.20377  ORF Transcript_9496/g.20377 Transcript_9496/m.20377 type:complete len:286 (+) Transcript_9496:1217-2074(+)
MVLLLSFVTSDLPLLPKKKRSVIANAKNVVLPVSKPPQAMALHLRSRTLASQQPQQRPRPSVLSAPNVLLLVTLEDLPNPPIRASRQLLTMIVLLVHLLATWVRLQSSRTLALQRPLLSLRQSVNARTKSARKGLAAIETGMTWAWVDPLAVGTAAVLRVAWMRALPFPGTLDLLQLLPPMRTMSPQSAERSVIEKRPKSVAMVVLAKEEAASAVPVALVATMMIVVVVVVVTGIDGVADTEIGAAEAMAADRVMVIAMIVGQSFLRDPRQPVSKYAKKNSSSPL